MVLESLHAKATLKVSGLIIQEPGQNQHDMEFNPELDIPASFRHRIEEVLLNRTSRDHIEILSSYLEMFPQRLNVLSRTFASLNDFSASETSDMLGFSKTKALYPQARREDVFGPGYLSMLEEKIPATLTYLSSGFPVIGKLEEFREAFYLKTLFPERFETATIGPKAVKEVINMLKNRQRAGKWSEFAMLAAEARILFGPNTSISIDQHQWQEMKRTLNIYQNNAPIKTYCNLAADMFVLSAESATFTENGLKLTFSPKKSFNQPSTPLPEARRF